MHDVRKRKRAGKFTRMYHEGFCPSCQFYKGRADGPTLEELLSEGGGYYGHCFAPSQRSGQGFVRELWDGTARPCSQRRLGPV